MALHSRRGLLAGGAAAGGLLAITPRVLAAASGPTLSPKLADSEANGVYVFGVSAQGYVAEEYLMSGQADVFETVDMADAWDFSKRDSALDLGRRTFEPKLVAAAQPYVTRLILYRPADPARFSGDLIVESIHPSGGGSAAVWGPMNAFFQARGDAYVLVQHPVTIAGLKALVPERYGALSVVHPTQVWGMLRDAGRILKQGGADSPLRGFKVRRAYMTGYSYTGVATATFANFHHAGARLADGRPVYDGYLPMANATYVRPLDVPVMRMNTQSDFDSFGGLHNRSPDSDDPAGRHRLYEVAGAAHVRSPLQQAGAAAPPRFAKSPPTAGGQPSFSPSACYDAFPKGSRSNDMPFPLAAAAMVANMSAWVDEGRAPPHAPLIETAPDGATRLDADGNALGGLRLPELVVPAATYGVGKGSCMLFGFTQAFTPERMKALYGDKARYLAEVRAAAERKVTERLLLADAVPLIVAEASARPSF